jgi:hypothetical protein
MSGYARLVFSSIGFILTFAANSVYAGLITFNVDLSGVDEYSGNTLRVYGTLTIDPGLPTTSSGITSMLNLQWNSEHPIQFPGTPIFSGPVSENLAWTQINKMLFINRTASEGASISWESNSSPLGPYTFFSLGSGASEHRMSYWKFNEPKWIFDDVILSPSGPPDGPFGFLVGNAIPESSSVIMTAVCWVIFPLLR